MHKPAWFEVYQMGRLVKPGVKHRLVPNPEELDRLLEPLHHGWWRHAAGRRYARQRGQAGHRPSEIQAFDGHHEVDRVAMRTTPETVVETLCFRDRDDGVSS